ncbi:protein NYNRIN-like [Abrus precatorius]|uniref:Protein NYNRIN-like n=1 Tax=Abrus precatorius TaxID=3816 RepID=A0A8B8KCW3_ABRPR|nr:protein NYNRIN-like [Abrus precatorius]
MIKDCFEYAKSWEECQKHGNIQYVPAAELHSIIKPWPFRGWALDLIGQIHPPLTKGHKFILVAVNYFTKWAKAIPLKEVTQNDVNFIDEYIIQQFRIPETLTIDQGIIFVGQKITQYAKSLNIKMVTSTPYYAQVNGQVEAVNKILIKLIKKHIGSKPRN